MKKSKKDIKLKNSPHPKQTKKHVESRSKNDTKETLITR